MGGGRLGDKIGGLGRSGGGGGSQILAEFITFGQEIIEGALTLRDIRIDHEFPLDAHVVDGFQLVVDR